jgi:hypothetical protein
MAVHHNGHSRCCRQPQLRSTWRAVSRALLVLLCISTRELPLPLPMTPPPLLLHYFPPLALLWLSVVIFFRSVHLSYSHLKCTGVSELVQLASYTDASSKSDAKDVAPLASYIDASSKPIVSLHDQATTVQTRRRANGLHLPAERLLLESCLFQLERW